MSIRATRARIGGKDVAFVVVPQLIAKSQPPTWLWLFIQRDSQRRVELQMC